MKNKINSNSYKMDRISGYYKILKYQLLKKPKNILMKISFDK